MGVDEVYDPLKEFGGLLRHFGIGINLDLVEVEAMADVVAGQQLHLFPRLLHRLVELHLPIPHQIVIRHAVQIRRQLQRRQRRRRLPHRARDRVVLRRPLRQRHAEQLVHHLRRQKRRLRLLHLRLAPLRAAEIGVDRDRAGQN